MGSGVGAPGLQSTGSIVVAHRLSCSESCEIFPNQGSNLCLLRWQADSLPLSHQGSPLNYFLIESVDQEKHFKEMKLSAVLQDHTATDFYAFILYLFLDSLFLSWNISLNNLLL